MKIKHNDVTLTLNEQILWGILMKEKLGEVIG